MSYIKRIVGWIFKNAPKDISYLRIEIILFDFVSFLLDEAQTKKVTAEPQSINLPRMDLEEQIVEVRVLEDDVEQFLADGFEPIIEIELE